MEWGTLTKVISPLAFVSAVVWGAANLVAQSNELERRLNKLEIRIEQMESSERDLERRVVELETARKLRADAK